MFFASLSSSVPLSHTLLFTSHPCLYLCPISLSLALILSLSLSLPLSISVSGPQPLCFALFTTSILAS